MIDVHGLCVAGDIPEPCWFVETNEKEVAGIMNSSIHTAMMPYFKS